MTEVDIAGGGDLYFPQHNRKFPHTHITPAIIKQKREQLRKQRELWELERELENEVLEFREIQEAWLEDQVTLDEMLERMMETGLCNKLSVWRNRK